MGLATGVGIGIQFSRGGGQSWESYFLTRTPTDLVATVIDETSILISWADAAEASDGLKIYLNDVCNSTVAYGVGFKNITGLTTATSYVIKLVAYKGTNESDPLTDTVITYNSAMIAGWEFDDTYDQNSFNNTLSHYPIHPIHSPTAQYFNGKTYIVYQGVDADPYIITYTHSTSTWSSPVKVGTNPLNHLTDQNHGEPAMLVDLTGYIHIIFGSHMTEPVYVKSTNPEDITAWTNMTPPVVDPEDCSYPQLIQFSTGRIYLLYRVDAAPMIWSIRTSDNGGSNWSAATQITADYAYPKIIKGTGDNFHLAIIGDGNVTRENVYYIYFDGTNYKNIAGDTLSLPVAIADASDIIVRDSGGNYVMLATIDVNASNEPFLFFLESTAATEFCTCNYKIAKYEDAVWVVVDTGAVADSAVDYASAIDVLNDKIDIYANTGSEPITRGGAVERWSSSDNGDTWGRVNIITKNLSSWPILVKDYISNAKLVFASYLYSMSEFICRGFLWGENGFVQNTAIAEYLTAFEGESRGYYPIWLYSGAVVTADSLVFAGGSAYGKIVHNNNLSFNGGSPDKPFSVTFEINVASTAGLQSILVKRIADPVTHNEYEIDINANTIRIFVLNDAGTAYRGASAPFTTTGSFVTVCMTYSGGGLVTDFKIYLNNIESQSATITGGTYAGMANTGINIYIGSHYATGGYLTGSIKNLKIWNKILTETERTNVYNNVSGW